MKFPNKKKPKRAETTIIEPTKSTATIKHPRERKEVIKENIAKKKKKKKNQSLFCWVPLTLILRNT